MATAVEAKVGIELDAHADVLLAGAAWTGSTASTSMWRRFLAVVRLRNLWSRIVYTMVKTLRPVSCVTPCGVEQSVSWVSGMVTTSVARSPAYLPELIVPVWVATTLPLARVTVRTNGNVLLWPPLQLKTRVPGERDSRLVHEVTTLYVTSA
jgi:hypothetical protein